MNGEQTVMEPTKESNYDAPVFLCPQCGATTYVEKSVGWCSNEKRNLTKPLESLFTEPLAPVQAAEVLAGINHPDMEEMIPKSKVTEQLAWATSALIRNSELEKIAANSQRLQDHFETVWTELSEHRDYRGAALVKHYIQVLQGKDK